MLRGGTALTESGVGGSSKRERAGKNDKFESGDVTFSTQHAVRVAKRAALETTVILADGEVAPEANSSTY